MGRVLGRPYGGAVTVSSLALRRFTAAPADGGPADGGPADGGPADGAISPGEAAAVLEGEVAPF